MKRLKQLLSAVIILASFAFIVYYWRSHPEIVTQLKQVSPLTIAALLGLYAVMTFVLVLIYDTILQMCGKRIPIAENSLLTMYSSIINFFGPLQSGPGFRTVYLKQKHGVSMRSYISGTLVYYALFGMFNAVFLALGIITLAYAPFLLLAVVMAILAVGYIFGRAGSRSGRSSSSSIMKRFQPYVSGPLFTRLAILSLLQAVIVVVIYTTELRAIGNPVSLTQAIAYSGAGSLALFVSLTPGALGFRESFQYVSQGIHHVNSNAIVTANLLDRSVYVVFLGILMILVLAFHAQKRLKIELAEPTDPKAANHD